MKGLDYSNERYVRIFTRDTTNWCLLSWQARSLYLLISRKLDRAGVLDLEGEDPVRAIAANTGVPEDVVSAALPELVGPRGQFQLNPDYDHGSGCIFDPTFREKEEARQSDAARSRAARERRRDLAKLHDVTKRDSDVTNRDVTNRDGGDSPHGSFSNSDAGVRNVTVTERDGSDTNHDASLTFRDETVTASHTASHSVTPNLTQPSLTQPNPAQPTSLEPVGGRRHPDEDFSDNVTPQPREEYTPTQFIWDQASSAGIAFEVVNDALGRYRQTARQVVATQRAHDAAFKSFLKTFAARESKPVDATSTEQPTTLAYYMADPSTRRGIERGHALLEQARAKRSANKKT